MKKLLVITALVLCSSSWSLAQAQVEPPGGMQELAAYSIFLENYKNESYESAIKYGRWIWQNMPNQLKGYNKFDLERNLDRLIKSYGGAAENASDPSVKEAYVDTALIIFDKVFDNFSESDVDYYNWYVRKGRFIQTHSDNIDNASDQAAAEYEKAFNRNPEEFTKLADGYYMRVMLQSLTSAGEKDKALAIIDEAEPHAGPKLKDYFNEARNDLFENPQERMTFLEGRLQQEPENTEILKQLRSLYSNQGMNDKLMEINQKLYKIDPSLENTKTLAEAALSNANYDQAIKYLKEAIGKTDDNKEKARLALEISNAYENKEELQTARQFARQALNHNPQWGDPLIQIADIYALAVNRCTSGRKMNRDDKVVYWLVLDYLDKARSTDSSVSNNVKRKYDAYEPVTPTTEEKFFKGWETGDKINVDASINQCYSWIDEATTVR